MMRSIHFWKDPSPDNRRLSNIFPIVAELFSSVAIIVSIHEVLFAVINIVINALAAKCGRHT